MLLNDGLADGQAQAGSLAYLGIAKKWIKDIRQV